MSNIIRGLTVPQLQDQHWNFDPMRGHIYRAEWRGLSQSDMIDLYSSYVANGIECEVIAHVGDTATLIVSDSTGSNVIDSWEVVGNEERRDGLGHPYLITTLISAGLDPDKVLQDIRSHLANNDDPTTIFGPGGDFDTSSVTYGAAWTVLERFYSLQTRGSTEYERGQYVLRHKTNVSNRWTINIADFGVDRIYTPAQLLSEASNALLWVFPLPARLYYKIANIPAPTAISNYQWGWLKKASTETTEANNRVCIQTEYICEQWSTDYYTPY